jgi:ubiquinone/menaquinone biosynthesis C-methylase UbiE
MSAAVLDQLAILSDPTRARILAVLDRQELTVSELCDILQLPQSTVSRHLRTLGDAGWTASRREGTSRFYSLPLDDLDPASRRLWRLVREEVASTPAALEDERRSREVLARRRSASQAFFSSAAGQWDKVRAELFGADSHLRALAGLLDPEWQVGDLGCGTGELAAVLAPFVSRVIAVDASVEMLEAARARLRDVPGVELREGALERLPVDDGSLDAACMVLVLHHLPDPRRALAEAARVLKPAGRLLLVDMLPHAHEEYRQTMGHVWLGFESGQVRRWLADAGFDAARIVPLPPDPRAKGPSLFVAAARRHRGTPPPSARPAAAARTPEAAASR